MNRSKQKACDVLGCTCKATEKVVSWIHPMTGIPVWRNYCSSDLPVHCPICKFTVGIRPRGIDKRKKKRLYRCESCRENFSLELSR